MNIRGKSILWLTSFLEFVNSEPKIGIYKLLLEASLD